ncbi:acetyl-CoA carboxylase biotin carboxylase subunit family protein [Rickettsiales bacterium LUAb2]
MIKKTIVLLESFPSYANRLLLAAEEASKLGYEAILVTSYKSDLFLADRFPHFLIDGWEDEILENLYLNLAKSYNIVGFGTTAGSAVSTYNGLPSSQIAKIAKKYGFVANDADALLRVNNKLLMRAALYSEPLFSSNYALLEEGSNIDNICNNFEFPVIIKPAIGGSSRYVSKCSNVEEVKKGLQYYFDHCSNNISSVDISYNYNGKTINNQQAMLIEEYFDGIELSIECFCHSNGVDIVLIHEKPDVIYSKHCVYENLLITPVVSFGDNQLEHVKHYISKLIKALGLANCFCHIELKVDNKNNIGLIEINPRLGASRIRDNIMSIYGVTPEEVLIKNLVGENVKFNRQTNEDMFYAMSVVFPHESGILDRVIGIEKLNNIPEILGVNIAYSGGETVNGIDEEEFVADVWYKSDSIERIKQIHSIIMSDIKIAIK